MSDPDAKTRYALRAVLDLARHNQGPDHPLKVRDIARRTSTPPKYLVHILLSLKRRALVNSTRGAKGGYWLMRPPETISVAEIVDAVSPDGPATAPVRKVPADEAVNRVWDGVGRNRRQFLAGITLADLLRDLPEE